MFELIGDVMMFFACNITKILPDNSHTIKGKMNEISINFLNKLFMLFIFRLL
jgi:hypothetical protein